ncbi:MAG TPA: capsular biosynthesis protein, partial [Xanthobacteraceae bacterium]
MTPLSSFTPRMWLILAHDLLATAAAVVASFFIRFEADGIAQRWRLLAIFLPAFVVYSAFVYGLSGLYKAKWRFTSLPDLFNIVRATTVLAVTLLALDYVLLTPNVYGTFFFGKITIALYWLLQIAFLSGPRIAYRYFRYTRTLQHARAGDSTPILVVGRTADA